MAEIRKLETWQEWLESDRIVATAFLHDWDEKKATEQFQAEASGENPRVDTTWGLFNDEGKMMSTIVTCPARLTFEGQLIDCDEVHMVGSLPENRGGGNIRKMMDVVLHAFKEKGDPFAILMPFSFVFYRKFGFEGAECEMIQKAKISQFAPFSCDLDVHQVDCQEDVDQVRALYERHQLKRNLGEMKTDHDWQYRGGGEFGERDWWYGDKRHYTYLFRDEEGQAQAYFTFLFNNGPEGPFVGSMEVIDIAFESPEALRSIFGFIYGMRAKITEVKITMPRELDLGVILPEGDDVERTIRGHQMARVLDVEKVLMMLRHPEEEGSYRIHIEDKFMPENTGTYEVDFAGGRTMAVNKTGEPADLAVTEETFLQMAIGLTDLELARYREGTKVYANEKVLKAVFRRKML